MRRDRALPLLLLAGLFLMSAVAGVAWLGDGGRSAATTAGAPAVERTFAGVAGARGPIGEMEQPGHERADGTGSAARSGAALVGQLGCAACHTGLPSPSESVPAPALDHAGLRYSTAYLFDYELKPRDDMAIALARARRSTDPREIAELALSPAGESPMARFAGLADVLERALQPDQPEMSDGTRRRLTELARDPDLDTRSLALAALHFARGEDPEVRALLAEEMLGFGGDDARIRRRWTTALGFMGDRLRETGRAGDGVVVYQKALEVLPQDPRLLPN